MMMQFIFDTSASTGAAKRVLMSERAFMAAAEVEVADLGITAKSVVSVDRWAWAAVQKFYWAKLTGCRLAIYPGHEKVSMRIWIREQGITHLSILASTFRWLASGLFTFPSVEVLDIGGEMVDWADVPIARESFPNAAIINRYATTETRVICRKHVGVGQAGEGRMPVGKPIKGVEISIGGKFGDTGEIVVRSPYMAEGYYNDPELTAAKFINGWYYTGDLGYWLSNGELMHCGRKDFAVVEDKFDAEKCLHERNMKSALNGGDVR